MPPADEQHPPSSSLPHKRKSLDEVDTPTSPRLSKNLKRTIEEIDANATSPERLDQEDDPCEEGLHSDDDSDPSPDEEEIDYGLDEEEEDEDQDEDEGLEDAEFPWCNESMSPRKPKKVKRSGIVMGIS